MTQASQPGELWDQNQRLGRMGACTSGTHLCSLGPWSSCGDKASQQWDGAARPWHNHCSVFTSDLEQGEGQLGRESGTGGGRAALEQRELESYGAGKGAGLSWMAMERG